MRSSCAPHQARCRLGIHVFIAASKSDPAYDADRHAGGICRTSASNFGVCRHCSGAGKQQCDVRELGGPKRGPRIAFALERKPAAVEQGAGARIIWKQLDQCAGEAHVGATARGRYHEQRD